MEQELYQKIVFTCINPFIKTTKDAIDKANFMVP